MQFDYDVALVSAKLDDNWYGLQLKGFSAPGESIGWYDFQQTFGFASRPLDATISPDDSVEGCLVFKVDAGRKGGMAWLGSDPRLVNKCPPMSRGSSAQWNARQAFSLLDYDSNTHTTYVPVEFDGSGTPTKAHLIQVGVDANGKKVIDMRHCDGMAIVMLENSVVIKNAAGDAYLELNADGVVLNGNTKVVGGLDVGGSGAQPLVNGTAFNIALATMAAALSNLTPLTPYEIGLHASLLALVAAFPACQTVLTKGL